MPIHRLLALTTTASFKATAFSTSNIQAQCHLNHPATSIQALRSVNTCPAPDTVMSDPTPEWLQEQLSGLLALPYIHFTQPKIPGLSLRMGPGPIDLFSTRFSNIFSKEATGVIVNQEVDRDDLKQGLLKLQKKWNKDSVQFASHNPEDGHQVCICIHFL